MAFITQTICTQCRQKVDKADLLTHEQDCPESPENQKKRAVENAALQKRTDELDACWNKWQKKREKGRRRIMHAIPSIDYKPLNCAHKGKCILVDFDEELQCYTSKVLTNPTWGTVLAELDKAIFFTRDTHHCFLEGIYPIKREHLPPGLQPAKGVAILQFETGS